MLENIKEIQSYMFEPQSDLDSDKESVVHQNQLQFQFLLLRCSTIFAAVTLLHAWKQKLNVASINKTKLKAAALIHVCAFTHEAQQHNFFDYLIPFPPESFLCPTTVLVLLLRCPTIFAAVTLLHVWKQN